MEALLSILKKYEYPHRVHGEAIYVRIGSSQEISISYTEAGTIKIKDRLKAWNPLTGIIEMSVKGSIIFNLIGTLLLLCLFAYLDNLHPSNAYLFIGIGLLGWILLLTTYYHTKAINFKHQVMAWIEQSGE